jgi:hypothetical protein
MDMTVPVSQTKSPYRHKERLFVPDRSALN